MITIDDLLFVSLDPKKYGLTPQWSVRIGGLELAKVIERTITFPKYRVEISDEEDKLFANREEVIDYILAVLNK